MSAGSSLDEPDRLDQNVWYAAFGSNVSKARFLRYIQGGPIPHSTDGRRQDAARDQTLPSGDQPFEIDRTLFFSGSSSRWGNGGVAFLDADTRPAVPVRGRAWRISLGQLEDLFRQENGQRELASINLAELVALGRLDVLESWYGRLEVVGQIDGLPVITLASPKPPVERRPAHISYLAVIAEGLAESWSMETSEAARYLAGLPGNAGHYSISILERDLARDVATGG